MKTVEEILNNGSRIQHIQIDGTIMYIEKDCISSMKEYANALIGEGYVEKAAYVALENILAKTEAALLAQKEISKKLEFMINNGLGFEDMINDITMPHEL